MDSNHQSPSPQRAGDIKKEGGEGEGERQQRDQVMKVFAFFIQIQGAILLKGFNETSETKELHKIHLELFPT